MEPLPVAIIGTGGISRAHIDALRLFPEAFRVVAAMDVDPERVGKYCQEHNIPESYTDLNELLAKVKPGLVTIATPPSTHKAIIVQSLEAGSHVWCEKPLCASLAELDEIQAAEKKSGKSCATIFQWRYASVGQYFRRMQQEGLFGRMLVGLVQTAWYRKPAYYEVPWRGQWSTELGGPTMGLGIHAMDFYLNLMEPWEEIRAMAATLDREIQVEDISTAMVRFADHHIATMVNTCLSPRQASYLRWDFQEATVELSHLYQHRREHWKVTLPDGTMNEKLTDAWASEFEDRPGSHESQLRSIIAALTSVEPLPASTASVRETTDFLSSLYKSAFTGDTVKRGSIQPGDPFYEHVAGSFQTEEGARRLKM